MWYDHPGLWELNPVKIPAPSAHLCLETASLHMLRAATVQAPFLCSQDSPGWAAARSQAADAGAAAWLAFGLAHASAVWPLAGRHCARQRRRYPAAAAETLLVLGCTHLQAVQHQQPIPWPSSRSGTSWHVAMRRSAQPGAASAPPPPLGFRRRVPLTPKGHCMCAWATYTMAAPCSKCLRGGSASAGTASSAHQRRLVANPKPTPKNP